MSRLAARTAVQQAGKVVLSIIVGLLIATAAVAGCAGTIDPEARYPAQYASVVDATSPPPESVQDTAGREAELFASVPHGAHGFVQLMRGLADNPDWEGDARQVYADELYFSDTLGQANSIDELIEHLRGVRANAPELRVVVDDVTTGSQGTYLRWRMESTFEVLGRPRVSRTIGVSLLRFNDEGQIVFQQDFWDAAEGFYQHIPGLGSIIRSIGGRFQ